VSCSVTARCTPGRVPKGGGDGRSQGGESLTRVKATDCIGPGAPGLSGAALLVPRADRQRVSRRAESHRLAIGTTHALCPGTPPVRPASPQRRSARYAQPWALSFSDSEAHLSAVILSPFAKTPAAVGFLRRGHVADARFWAGTRTKSGIEKRKSAGQGRMPHIRYVGDTTSDNVSTTQLPGPRQPHCEHPKTRLR
jgi:hypothetical protein